MTNSMRDAFERVSVIPPVHKLDRGAVHTIADTEIRFTTRDRAKIPPGKPRLVAIFQNQQDNDDPLVETVLVVPITTKGTASPSDLILDKGDGGLAERSIAKTSLLQPVLKKHLGERIGKLCDDTVEKLTAQLLFNIGLTEEADPIDNNGGVKE